MPEASTNSPLRRTARPPTNTCTALPLPRNPSKHVFRLFDWNLEAWMDRSVLTSKTAIVVDGDSAYTMTVDSQGGGVSTKEVLVAKRVGDCAQ